MRFTKIRAQLLIAIAVVMAISGGFSTAAFASSKAKASSSTKNAAKDVKQAASLLNKYRAIPKFVPPNASFKASALKGKTVALVAINLTTPALLFAIDGTKKAAAAVGIHTTVFDGKNEPSLMTEGLQQAIGQHVGAIALFGVPVGLVTSQLQSANKAGIPIVNVENNQPDAKAQGQGAGPHIYASASENMNLEAQLAASSSVVQTKGHAKAIIMDTPQLTPAPPIVKGFKQALSRCSDCSVVTTTQTQIQDWSTGLASQTTSTLRAYPQANVILPIFDTMALFVVPAVQSSGAGNRVTVQSTSGFPAAARMMLKFPHILTGLAGQNDYWSGWLALNQMMRGMLKLKPGNPVVPSRFVTPSVVRKSGTGEGALYGNSYIKGFKKLWGV